MQLSASQLLANPWRYASGQHDGATGLTKFGTRYQNPDHGRFTQRDPSGRDLPYAYASCNPTNNTDPTGRDDAWEYAGIVLASGVLAIPFGIVGAEVGGPYGGAAAYGCAAAGIGYWLTERGDATIGGGLLACGVGAVAGLTFAVALTAIGR